jgi:hypothetical protein
MNNHQETFIWVPLIGFDKAEADRGVARYYDTIQFKPHGVSLFVFSPDIVNQHTGMEEERTLPPDHCNYYGTIRNGIRDIQEWTNYDLRELVSGLEGRGAETYLGIMGVYTGEDATAINHYNVGHHEWLTDHQELMGVWTVGRYALHVLKRFKDGTYYEDFFVEKLRQTLKDYGFTGVHASDNFCPPGTGGSARNGDFSDDMIDQFIAHSGLDLPVEVRNPVDDRDIPGIKKRADFIWNRYKEEWLEFLTWRWAGFWGKVSRALHEDGKKVMVNNAWCSEPFEAVYRYGIDYKLLHEAGVDYIVAESVPTSVYSGKDEPQPYRFYQYMTMTALMKVAHPEGQVICLNSVGDASEEWATVAHYPSATEREIYALANYYLQGPEGLQRANEGMMICLGDGLTEDEWQWVQERYAVAFSDVPRQVLTPTLIWSDAAHDKFLPDFIETKRWSSHKLLYEMAKCGGQIGAFARIENLANVSGPIFVPNADLLPAHEREALAAYTNGVIICTSLLERNFALPGDRKPDFYFCDPHADYKTCVSAYGLGYIDYSEILAGSEVPDPTPDIAGSPRYAPEPLHWRQDMIFRKVSQAFVGVCAALIRSQYSGGLTTELRHPFLPMLLNDGRIRVFLGNDNRLQYRMPLVKSERRIKKVTSHSKFPALPSKMVTLDGRVIVPKSDKSDEAVPAYGFVTKIPPGGMTILDIEFAEE